MKFTSLASILSARDKAITRANLPDFSNFPWFKFSTFERVKDLAVVSRRIGYPCVVKPSSATGSILAYPLYGEEDAKWMIDHCHSISYLQDERAGWMLGSGWICETLIDAPIITVFVVADAAGIRAVALARNARQDINLCVGFGSVLPVEISASMVSLLEFAENACRGLGLDLGFFDVEIFLTNAGPILIEVNARPPGGEMLRALDASTSEDLFWEILRIYGGEKSNLRRDSFYGCMSVYKIMAAEAVCLRKSVCSVIQKLFSEFDILFYVEQECCQILELEPLDLIARIVSPTDNPMVTFSDMTRRTELASRDLGFDLILGNLPDLPELYKS
ncbi:hypothetical protein BV379_03000 [Rhodovulum sulfidophilum]|nr:hypothetical protein BV379_03000 [Rhodovulum sulfidophilum]